MNTNEQVDVLLSAAALDAEACRRFVSVPSAGGQVLFIGAVRNQTGGRPVEHLEYEAYPGMAEKEMRKIAEKAVQQFGCYRIAIHHRTGILGIGEVAVVIAVSSAHRGASFEACQFAIDTLKSEVPIWKKEVFEDGETWVSPRP